MSKTTFLRILYTGAAVVLGGLLSLHIVPAQFAGYAQGVSAYLIAHSFLPSAKTGGAG